ncbi:MAG: hypothetical protein BHV76_01400 [Phocaeicola plebeius]|mgnify:CR=1 FL=1|uniref:Helix-turn-helix domain-containing protein n=1 Tax=Phocaeicola plebeius TaxID=310297 RepID=A0A854C3Z2_9BACT|nr:hypothetical protein [Phocaeicola plebeius]OKZ12580.1 MAG: hypothetical protein BHV76_01400 [Phocaeicola plebeius]
MENINYQFTQVPTKLMILLDVNCRSMLFTLCQLSSHYTKEDGRFFRTNADLALESRLSQKLVIATLDTLYTHGIVEIWSVGKGKGKHANYFKLNLERIKEFERLKMDELKNPELQLPMVDYRAKGYSPSYLKKNTQNVSQEIPNDFPRISQITNNINNIENIDNEENKKNIDNKEGINNKENKRKFEVNCIMEIDNKDKAKLLFNNDEFNYIIGKLIDKGLSRDEIMDELKINNPKCYDYFNRASSQLSS